ncbi:MAG: hypothetical protein M1816_008224 [Peltula sp. TS41687]|nr:MAG: hypothetical protein M1816_008224 [Peltula sp. TS41687]
MADDKEWVEPRVLFMNSADDEQATKYLLDPLNAPAPNDETGPGSQSTISAVKDQMKKSSGSGPKKPTSTTRETPPSYTSKSAVYPTPPTSTNPHRVHFPRLSPSNRNKPPDMEHHQSQSKSRLGNQSSSGDTRQPGRRRASSLTSRFPGDKTHHPLEMLKRGTKIAQRAPHLRKQYMPGPDLIDNLDNVGTTTYHHEGPYDAALLARNLTPQISPLEAVRSTNEKALRATPKENVRDALERHRPLDGVASIPPGMRDLSGDVMEYEEGTDMMIENGGNYKRWSGLEYHPDDLKGKGEPSYSIELALKQQQHKRNDHRRVLSDGDSGYEMTSRPSSSGARDGGNPTGPQAPYRDWQDDVRRSNTTTGRSGGQGLKSKFGSLRKRG